MLKKTQTPIPVKQKPHKQPRKKTHCYFYSSFYGPKQKKLCMHYIKFHQLKTHYKEDFQIESYLFSYKMNLDKFLYQ